jgi:hypothetical protein
MHASDRNSLDGVKNDLDRIDPPLSREQKRKAIKSYAKTLKPTPSDNDVENYLQDNGLGP